MNEELKKSGIYKITNVESGKLYVGSAVNIARRWMEHKAYLRHGYHHSRHLQRAWELYGEHCFVFEVLEFVEKESLIAREQHWIDVLQAFGKRGYNASPMAQNSLGIKRSDETRRKISESKKGSTPWNKGKQTGPQSPELVKRRFEKLIGVSRPDEVKQSISETKKAKGQKPTPEVIAKSAEARKAQAAMRRAGLLPPLYDEERRKQVGQAISAAMKAAKAARLQQLLNK